MAQTHRSKHDPLRLTTHRDRKGAGDSLEPIPFERRVTARTQASGTMQAVRCSGLQGPMLFGLSLRDASWSGLGAQCSVPLEVGARLSLRVDPVHGNWRTAVVTRCTPATDGGYSVGLTYAHRMAA